MKTSPSMLTKRLMSGAYTSPRLTMRVPGGVPMPHDWSAMSMLMGQGFEVRLDFCGVTLTAAQSFAVYCAIGGAPSDRARARAYLGDVGPRTYFAVIDRAEHSGHVTSVTGPAWPAEGGWTYQHDVTGAHGAVLYEGPSEEQARADLAAYLVCDAPERGTYCYSHNPRPEQ